MTDQTRAALEKRLSAMIGDLNKRRAADLDQVGTYTKDTISYDDLVRGFAHACNAMLRAMTPAQVRESVRSLEQSAANEALLVRPSWSYCRGAAAAAILAEKLDQIAV